jgi:hypothetical protein
MGPVAQLALWKILLGGRAFELRLCNDYILFVTVDGVWGSVGYIYRHSDRDQVDAPELCSNKNRFFLL